MRFVVLEHGHPHEYHWDILFEDPHCDALRSWSLPAWPPSAGWTSAIPKDPHRKLYLNYEGPISGSRGWVRRRESGNYRLQWESPDEFRVILSGNRLKGILELRESKDGVWQCRFQLALGA
ncbi:MAG: hypothetical protein U1D30_08835 [Planctomycetota bacterium]